MSETQVEADFSATIVGYKFTPDTVDGNGKRYGAVNFGSRSLKVCPLDMAEQWDLLEIAPAGKEGSTWFNVANVAASVKEIDGMPMPPGWLQKDAKAEIRRRLVKLGTDGIRAAMAGLSDMAKLEETAAGDANAAVLAIAKN